jgi:uncharacterized protein YggE
MRRVMKIAVLALGFAMSSGGAVLADVTGQITVTGEGVVVSTPDMASLSLGVTTLAETAALALADNNAAMQTVMARLKDAGIEDRDLQTSNLQLQPNWVHNEAKQAAEIKGYTASNMVTARVRDLSILGAVLDAAVQDGANTLSGLSFEKSDPKPAQSQARKLAIEDARARATEMLQAAGAGLGKIISIAENSGYVSPMPMMKAAMESSDVPVAAGEVGTSAQVTIVFEITQ